MQGILKHCLEMQYNIEHTQSEIRLFRPVSFGFLPTYRVGIGGETGEDSHHKLIDFTCGYSSVCVKNKDKYSLIDICEIQTYESFCILTVF